MINKNSLFNFLMVVLLVALPISKGIASVAAVGIFITSLYRADFGQLKVNIRNYPHVAALALISLAYCIGMAYTENFQKGLQIVMKSHRFVFFPLAILLNAALVKQHLFRYLNAFLLGLTAASIFTLGLLLLPEPTVIQLVKDFPVLSDYPLNDDRLRYGLYSPFIDRIQYSDLLGIGMVCTLYLAMKTERKLLYSLLAGFMLLTSMLLGGRGGQLGLFGGICIFITGNAFIFFYPKLRERIGKTAAISALMGFIFTLTVIAPLGIYQLVPSVKKRYDQMLLELRVFAKDTNNKVNYEHKTTVRRIVSWQNHWEIVKENPVFGVGTGEYESALNEAYATDKYTLPVNSHSQYLHLWVTLGIWGLLLFLGIIIYWLKVLAGPTQEFIFALAFIVHYSISFIPDAVLLMQVDAIAFSLFFCFIGLFKAKGNLGSYMKPAIQSHAFKVNSGFSG